MIDTTSEVADRLIREALSRIDVSPRRIEYKNFPDEVNVLLYVTPADFVSAIDASSAIEDSLRNETSQTHFVVVRRAEQDDIDAPPSFDGMQDARVAELLRLISAKSRVSSAEPSLVYVTDARASLSTVTASRHHLIFGRRGAGKSALMMEARRQVVADNAIDSWTNIQTLRHETPQRVFLFVVADVLSAIIAGRQVVSGRSNLTLAVNEMHEQVRGLLARDENTMEEAQRIVPRVQRALAQFLSVEGRRVIVFIDDFYYMPRDVQPTILDMLHGAFRDANAWMKVASIRHLTNWWQASPPTGLQSGQDADLIDLDVTLQDPEKASLFLEGILAEYARRVGIPSLSRIFNRSALDRLVLASGAVPRDYMVLAVSAINRALRRPNARATGVQDVNQAAGDAASAKINELEEDMAANSGVAERTLATLAAVRDFCLNEQSYTYFLVGYRDKETSPKLYSLLTALMDVRLIHLIDSGVSDAHEAGSRSEAYMLDLSQFSGSRLKQNITVLDFEDGHFVSKLTRSKVAPQRGSTSLQLIGILRRGPVLTLDHLSDALDVASI